MRQISNDSWYTRYFPFDIPTIFAKSLCGRLQRFLSFVFSRLPSTARQLWVSRFVEQDRYYTAFCFSLSNVCVSWKMNMTSWLHSCCNYPNICQKIILFFSWDHKSCYDFCVSAFSLPTKITPIMMVDLPNTSTFISPSILLLGNMHQNSGHWQQSIKIQLYALKCCST